VVTAALAQWVSDPLVVPYLPHLLIGAAAVIACYYALAYLGFAVPYLVDGLGALVGQTGAFVALTVIIAGLTLWTAGYAASMRRAIRNRAGDALVSWPPGNRDSVSR